MGPSKAVEIQHRTPSPNTQSGASVKFRAVILFFETFFCLLRARFIKAAGHKNTHTDSPPYNNHAEVGFGNCFRALGFLERKDPGANAGAFVGNMLIPPRPPIANFTRGVSLETFSRPYLLRHCGLAESLQ